jgi:protein dithiol oxidoreductase (disulfide-forming)
MRIPAARAIASGVLSGAVAVTSAFAQGTPREGIDYSIVQPPQPTNAPEGRVEVIEFFGYWCPACNAFEPTMRDWAGRHTVKEQVTYVPLPTHFKAGQASLQKLYYTLDVMGRETALRPKIFAAIHTERSLPDTATRKRWPIGSLRTASIASSSSTPSTRSRSSRRSIEPISSRALTA